MEAKTKHKFAVALSGLLYYWAAQRALERQVPKLRFEKWPGMWPFLQAMSATEKPVWTIIAALHLKELGYSDNVAFSGPLLGALAIEWWIRKDRRDAVELPDPALAPETRTGWEWPHYAWPGWLRHYPWGRLISSEEHYAGLGSRGGW